MKNRDTVSRPLLSKDLLGYLPSIRIPDTDESASLTRDYIRRILIINNTASGRVPRAE